MIRALILFSFAIIQLIKVGEASDYGKEKRFDVPIREQAVIISKEGYYPKRLSVFEGEKVRFFITSTLSHPSCFMMAEKEVFVGAQQGKVTEAEVYFEDAGTFEFSCPTGGIKGTITVLARKKKSKKQNREIASENVWRPREE